MKENEMNTIDFSLSSYLNFVQETTAYPDAYVYNLHRHARRVEEDTGIERENLQDLMGNRELRRTHVDGIRDLRPRQK